MILKSYTLYTLVTFAYAEQCRNNELVPICLSYQDKNTYQEYLSRKLSDPDPWSTVLQHEPQS